MSEMKFPERKGGGEKKIQRFLIVAFFLLHTYAQISAETFFFFFKYKELQIKAREPLQSRGAKRKIGGIVKRPLT